AYVVEDTRGGRASGTATITLTNTTPVATPDTFTTPAGTSLTFPRSVLADDTDADGDPLAAELVTSPPPSAGTLSLQPDGTGTFSPADGFAGRTTFTYRAADGVSASSPVTVTVVVSGPPVAVGDTATTGTGTAVDVPVLANDADPDGDPLTVVAVTDGAHGTVVALAGTGAVRYTPATGYAGPDTFTYTVSDGTSTSTATVDVTVTNAAPTAVPDVAGTTTTGPATYLVLANDTDPNIPGTDQQLRVTSATLRSGRATVSVTPDGLGVLVDPADDYLGDVVVDHEITDGAGGTSSTTLTVTVSDEAPVATDDTGHEVATRGSTSVDVLANDADPDGDPLAVADLSEPVDAGGTVRGTLTLGPGSRLLYTAPADGWAGTVTATYRADDGRLTSAPATLTVTVTNAPPTAVDDTATTTPATPVAVDVLANDADPNVPATPGQALVVTSATPGPGATAALLPDGRLQVTPATGRRDPVTVTYTVADGAGGTDHATLTVTLVTAAQTHPDRATTTPGRSVLVPVLANDDEGLTLVGAVSRAGSTVVVDGSSLRYTPLAGFTGEDVVTYTVADRDGLTTTGTLAMTVTGTQVDPSPPTTDPPTTDPPTTDPPTSDPGVQPAPPPTPTADRTTDHDESTVVTTSTQQAGTDAWSSPSPTALARTGAETGRPVLVAATSLLLGATLLLLSRRRRRR
ncbi:Ig-like domain-containing protein, partial [Pseudokineococcus sp. 1T1Z-3]|uniref:Ig-like domain-containing protein n=1 Tax=Pseudokineococcus sp. 1T1Z-3 TaxID=3132745 RepID=UPI0030A3D594